MSFGSRRGRTVLVSLMIHNKLSYAHSDSVEAIGFELGDIGCTDAMRLDGIDVNDEVLCIAVS